MDENQLGLVLYHNLKDKRDFFKGTFASNELNHDDLLVDDFDEPICFSFIVNNLQRENAKDMGHWLSVFVKLTGKKLYFKFVDSFKMPYTFYGKYIKEYVDHLRLSSMENNVQFIFEEIPFGLQSFKSHSCGGYAVYSVLSLKNCNSTTLRKIFSSFDPKEKMANDIFVEEYVVEKWPRTFCTDIFNKYNKVPFCSQKVFGRPGCLLKCRCTKKNCCDKLQSVEYIRPNIKRIFSY